ncbi:MAG: hypothetical protein ACREL9_02365 [Gemmatimonadales bacterium]
MNCHAAHPAGEEREGDAAASPAPADAAAREDQLDRAPGCELVDLEGFHQIGDLELRVLPSSGVVAIRGEAHRGEKVRHVRLGTFARRKGRQAQRDAVALAHRRPARNALGPDLAADDLEATEGVEQLGVVKVEVARPRPLGGLAEVVVDALLEEAPGVLKAGERLHRRDGSHVRRKVTAASRLPRGGGTSGTAA